MSSVPYPISNEAKASCFLFLSSFKSTVITLTIVVSIKRSSPHPDQTSEKYCDGHKWIQNRLFVSRVNNIRSGTLFGRSDMPSIVGNVTLYS